MTKFNKGLLFGISAYLIWGLLPLYWQLVEEAGAYEILAHRGIWSLLLCALLLALRKQIKSAFIMVRSSRTLSLLFLASGLLSINWAVYIWSVTVNRVVEAALGYYITPLINMDRRWIGLCWRDDLDRGIRCSALDCAGFIDLVGQL
ncbi:MAG: hypothetical protein RL421_1200 [Actinomycetota bacterium]